MEMILFRDDNNLFGVAAVEDLVDLFMMAGAEGNPRHMKFLRLQGGGMLYGKGKPPVLSDSWADQLDDGTWKSFDEMIVGLSFDEWYDECVAPEFGPKA
jgi:hypothetical protein